MSTKHQRRLTPVSIFPDVPPILASRNSFPLPEIVLTLRKSFPAAGKCFESPEMVSALRKKLPPPGNCFECPEIVFSAQKFFEVFKKSFHPLEIVMTVKIPSLDRHHSQGRCTHPPLFARGRRWVSKPTLYGWLCDLFEPSNKNVLLRVGHHIVKHRIEHTGVQGCGSRRADRTKGAIAE